MLSQTWLIQKLRTLGNSSLHASYRFAFNCRSLLFLHYSTRPFSLPAFSVSQFSLLHMSSLSNGSRLSMQFLPSYTATCWVWVTFSCLILLMWVIRPLFCPSQSPVVSSFLVIHVACCNVLISRMSHLKCFWFSSEISFFLRLFCFCYACRHNWTSFAYFSF